MKSDNRHVVRRFDALASGYAEKYANPRTMSRDAKLRRMELTLEYARAQIPRRVLDAGCGPGIVLSQVRALLPHAEVTGVDISPQMIEQARERNPGVRLIQSSLDDIPLPDASFDFVYALGVLDYLARPADCFRTIHRLLRPGGTFVFTWPNGGSLNRRLAIGLRRTLPFLFRNRYTAVSMPLDPAEVNRLISDGDFGELSRHYIAYGNGLVNFPWSVPLSRRMERWCGGHFAAPYVAWSCLCVVRKLSADEDEGLVGVDASSQMPLPPSRQAALA